MERTSRTSLFLFLCLWTACGKPMDVMDAMNPPIDLGMPDIRGSGLVAEFGGNRTVTVGDRVNLKGSTNAPMGTMVVYRWSLEAQPSASMVSLTINGDTATFVAEKVGEYVVRLEAFDGKRTSGPVRATIRVDPRIARHDVTNGFFNPNEVYLFGTIQEGSCGADAIAHWDDPNVAAAGFDCYADERTAQIRSDGILVYKNTFEDLLREFHCEGCPGFGRGKPYPSKVLDNDKKLATMPCDKIGGFLLGVTGARLHNCNGAWYDEAGKVLPFAQPLSYGHREKVLTNTAVVDLNTGQMKPIMGLSLTNVLATRAAPSGFWVALSTTPDPELWEISEEGIAKKLLKYPPAPMGYRAGFGARLDGKGNLYQMGSGMTFEDIIVYRSRDDVSKVVYTEATNPFVKIHISSLVTGP